MKDFFIITGPSGVGKSSLCRQLLKNLSGIRTATSHTTRVPRGTEKSGREYHFVDPPTFESMIKSDQFAEWTQIHGNYYGTSRREIENAEDDLVFEIEGHGAMQLKSQYDAAHTIFILPPSIDALRARLQARSEDDPEEIERRVTNALFEIQYAEQFEFLIINDDFDEAVVQLELIVKSHRLRKERVWPHVADRFRS